MRTRKLEAHKELVKEAYLNGCSLESLASVHGVSLGTIRNILKRMDVPLRKTGRPKENSHAIKPTL
jgi:DNA-directed RNA polymerase specialized sigma24 family protein